MKIEDNIMSDNRILMRFIPTVFFIIAAVSLGIMWRAVTVPAIIILPLVVHLIVHNKIMGRILGVFCMLATVFILVVLMDDILRGLATFGYFIGILMVLLSFFMSVLLFRGYNCKETVDKSQKQFNKKQYEL